MPQIVQALGRVRVPLSEPVGVASFWLKDFAVTLKSGRHVATDWEAVLNTNWQNAVIDARLLKAQGASASLGGSLWVRAQTSAIVAETVLSHAARVTRTLGVSPVPAPDASAPPVFIDGGDIVSVRRQDGSSVVLVGEHMLMSVMVLMRELGAFDNPAFAQTVAEADARIQSQREGNARDAAKELSLWLKRYDLAYGTLQNVLQRAQSLDYGAVREFMGLSTTTNDSETIESLTKYLTSSKLIADFRQNNASAALNALRQFEVSRGFVAQWLEVPVERVTVIPNILYHLDFYLKSPEPGMVMMPDPDDDIGYRPFEGKPQREYLFTVHEALLETKKRVESQSLMPVLLKGALKVAKDNLHAVEHSFFQGLMGTSEASGCGDDLRYFIVHRSTDEEANRTFAQFMKNQFKIEAIFLPPYATEGPFAAAGVDCASFKVALPLH